MAIEIFTRKEQKYLITVQQYDALIDQMRLHMRPDKNGQNGYYTVTSLYFDNADHAIYYETKNKLKFRQKLRLRVYDDATLYNRAFFEIKQKHKKVVNKRRMLLPLSEAYRYLKESPITHVDQLESSNPQVFQEIDHFRRLYRLEPEMIISYDRHALHGIEDENLRVTFDLNLRCRNYDLNLEHGSYGKHVIDSNLVVLEVKVDHSVPLWLTRLLQDLQCEQKSASKYCTSFETLQQNDFYRPYQEQAIAGGI
ncbi:MAG TPA: polyphosphate polymerase domain-containing protein [Pseudogracilibacillus sp.]|nr:polyphosphate polymerase domain-containing protein [Pseudogracilibacillus sp.]